MPALQADLQLWAGVLRFLSAVKCTPNDNFFFFTNSKGSPHGSVHYVIPRANAAPPPDMITRTDAKAPPPPPPPPPPDMITRTDAKAPPPSPLVLRVCYRLSLIFEPDIRGHEAPHQVKSGMDMSCARQSSGGVWKSRWPSWAPVPNKPTVSVDVKLATLNQGWQTGSCAISLDNGRWLIVQYCLGSTPAVLHDESTPVSLHWARRLVELVVMYPLLFL